MLRGLIAHVGNRVQAHGPGVRQQDRQRSQILDRLGSRDGAHTLFLVADARLPSRQLDLDALQLTGNVASSRAKRVESIGIEVDANLPVDAADALHRAHSFDRAELAIHREVDEPGQLLLAHRVGIHPVRQHRTARRGDPRYDRILHLSGQRGADAADRVAHVINCLLRGAIELKLDGGEGVAVRDGGADVIDPGHRCDRVLDLAGHLGLQLRRRDPGIVDAHRDRRDIQVRPVLDPEFVQAHYPCDGQRHEQDDDRDRSLDRPGGEVHVGPASSLTTLMRSPSCRKPAPRSTTRSLPLTPETISTRPSRTPPVST